MSVVKEVFSLLNLQQFNLCIACSGGLDSTVLLELTVSNGYQPLIMHINYQLRGEESEQDEAFVRELAQKHNLEIEVIRCPKELTKGKGINLQAAARKFRHEQFQRFIQSGPDNRLLLAHHADDQVETFFLQWMRGSGLFGLGGMHPEKNGIIRPFLRISKNDLKQYALQNGIRWREDSSNQASDYKRNQFRNIMLPKLLESNPGLNESILALQDAFRETQQEIRAKIDPLLKTWEQTCQIPFKTWQKLTIEEQIICCTHFGWPFWTLERIQGLIQAELSAKINNSSIFRTKDGFAWNSNFQEINPWEYKIQEVEFLPSNFNKWEIYLDAHQCNSLPVQGFADASDTMERMGVNGKTTVFKILKDAGIPEQWRNTYPIFRVGEEIIWIPGISVSKKHLATNATSLIIKLFIQSGRV